MTICPTPLCVIWAADCVIVTATHLYFRNWA